MTNQSAYRQTKGAYAPRVKLSLGLGVSWGLRVRLVRLGVVFAFIILYVTHLISLLTPRIVYRKKAKMKVF